MKGNFTLISLFILLCSQGGLSQSIVNSVHNLSASGPGSIKALSEQEICIFCHTPHNSKPDSPIWNKSDPGLIYDLYSSSTSEASTGQPNGSALLCLSCHDGTIALGNVLSKTSEIDFSGGITQMPLGSSCLSSDLSDDHPVSFLYNSALASADGQLKDPAIITFPVTLPEGYMQCTSCHDPHKNIYHDFLVTSTQFSELCIKCHDRHFWSASSHSTSSATWNGNNSNPWLHTTYTTVAENACENCHKPHSALSETGLLNNNTEENNCLPCHNGNVASTNIAAELSKSYIHNVENYLLNHDPAEDHQVLNMHVECVDCHNPHATNNSTALAPSVSGALAGVKGITFGNNPVDISQYQYEICFRCHSGNPDSPRSYTTRQIDQYNTQLEFNTENPSFHPIAGPGKNSDCPSLATSSVYSESSIIYCTDCHSSEDASSPKGPHGSAWPNILNARYEKSDYSIETPESYALCYKCHNRNSILNNESFTYHSKHIADINTPCNACHDPHGISSTQGTATNNSHLINFDLDIVRPNGSGALKFEDRGLHSGYCLLKCHGRGHGPGMSY